MQGYSSKFCRSASLRSVPHTGYKQTGEPRGPWPKGVGYGGGVVWDAFLMGEEKWQKIAWDIRSNAICSTWKVAIEI